MSLATFRAASRHRLLPHTSLRADNPDRHPVVGLVLDQHRRKSGARVARLADGVNDDDDERRRARITAESFVHQSD